MNAPLIGVLPLWDEHKDSLWMLPGYMNCLEQAGAVPVMLPLTEDSEAIFRLADTFDGFLFTGGHDVSPLLYGQTPLEQLGAICPQRDRLESVLFSALLDMDKPVLGICRGIQLFNALLGGSLYQDLPLQRQSTVNHVQTPPYDQPVHPVELAPGTPLSKLLHTTVLQVNSYHHQAIRDLSPALLPMATAPDGLVEAVYKPDHPFLWAVQWHPEFAPLWDSSRSIFREFVRACG